MQKSGMRSVVDMADLFCGAGGTSTGLLEAAKELRVKVRLVAINHWDVAIATHSKNHPDVTHINSNLEKVDPREAVPSGRLRLLVASPECTHHSRARGGKPVTNQNRASPKYILRWIAALDIEDILIENVPEFADWGPLHRSGARAGLPIVKRKGEYFQRFVRKIEAHGYQVQWRVLNAADYGDPTTRKRLFVIARKHQPVRWPEASHRQDGRGDMFGKLASWRPAKEIIDWTLKGESIFSRKRPLSPNTMRRIVAGLEKFGGKAFVIGQQSGAAPRNVDEPLPTVAGAGAIAMVQPFILPLEGVHRGNVARSVDDPLPTIIASRGGGYLVQPFIMAVNHGKDDQRSYSMDDPMPTVTSVDAWSIVQPFLVMLNGTSEAHMDSSHRSVEAPVPALTTGPHIGIAEPFLVPFYTERAGQKPRVHSINEPLPTVPTNNRFAVVQPYLVEYYGTGQAASVDDPLKTQTAKDRFGLVQPMILRSEDGRTYMMDILFRMLRPHELAAAMSFPKSYWFAGTREQVVKQIGNAVPRRLARALTFTLLSRL